MKPLLDLGVVAVNVLTRAAVGMDLEAEHLRRVAQRPKVLILGVLAQAAGLPLLGWALTQALPLPPPTAAGILLVAACPIGNIANFYGLLAGANLPLSVSMSALSIAASFGTIAITFEAYGRLLGARFAFTVPSADLTLKIMLMLVLPVLGGMALRHFWPHFAARRKRSVHRAGLAGVAFLLIYVLFAERSAVAAEWRESALAGVLFMVLALIGGLGLGHLLRLAPGDRVSLGITSAVRSVSLAMVIAITILGRIEYSVFAVVYFLVEIPLLLGVVAVCRRREWMPGSAWMRRVSG